MQDIKQKPFKRRQYIVDWSYQLRFTTRLFVAVLIVAIATFGVAAGWLWIFMDRPELPDRLHIIQALTAVSITLAVEVLISIPIIFFFGIRQSHRVVGPMARIKRSLETIGEGDFSPRIKLRDGDALVELAEQINRMAENLERRSGKVSDSMRTVDSDFSNSNVHERL
jgi:methyl-accepting chemotaxis protein